jgi:hypothetical protein
MLADAEVALPPDAMGSQGLIDFTRTGSSGSRLSRGGGETGAQTGKPPPEEKRRPRKSKSPSKKHSAGKKR